MTSERALLLALTTPNTALALFYRRLHTALTAAKKV
jgi:hypothetical protein